MASLKALKGRIASVKSTQKITKAMKMVAAAKLRRAQQAAEAGRPYAQRLQDVMTSLAGRVVISPQSPKLLAGTGKQDTHLLVVATSDRGLAGAFNSNIVRAARKAADELQRQGKTVYFYLVGRKGRAVIQRLYPKQIVHQHDTGAIKQVSFADAQAIATDLIDRYTTNGIDVVHLFYARFQSALVQEPTKVQLIPVPVEEPKGQSGDMKALQVALHQQTLAKPFDDAVIDLMAEKNLERPAAEERVRKEKADAQRKLDELRSTAPRTAAPVTAAAQESAVEYEPGEEEILAELLPRNVAVQIFRALLENAASEQGSRMTAMDNATRNAGDMINRLSIQYNRTRQAAITTELVEIISGAEAL